MPKGRQASGRIKAEAWQAAIDATISYLDDTNAPTGSANDLNRPATGPTDAMLQQPKMSDKDIFFDKFWSIFP
jgi:hypothetical protein